MQPTRSSLSQSTTIPYRTVRRWFGDTDDTPQYSADMRPDEPSRWLMLLLTTIFVVLNLPAWISMFVTEENTSLAAFVSAMVLYFLVKRGNIFTESDDEE